MAAALPQHVLHHPGQARKAARQQSAFPAKLTWVHRHVHVSTDMDIKLCMLITGENRLQSETAAEAQ